MSQFKKIIILFLLLGLNYSGLLAVGETLAFFSDEETSLENSLSAGTLDFSLDSYDNYISGLMYPTDTTATSIILTNNGSLATQYKTEIIPLGFDTSACDYIDLNSGDLLNFTSGPEEISTPATQNYTFTVDSLAPPSVWDKTCYFKWVFTAWDKDMTEPAGGFIDVEEKSGGIRIGKAIALNEILANPAGLDDAPKPNGEWVELYNNSNISFDLSGWYIYDSTDDGEVPIDGLHTNSGDAVIAPHGFLVVYRNGDSDFILNNAADNIRLFTARISQGGVMVDSYSYTMEKPEGFSYARIPDGIGDWVDPIPTPGRMNVLEGEIIEVPVVETEISGAELADEIFEEITGDEITEEIVEEVPTETITEEVPVESVEEVIPEIVPEEPAVIEETPAEEPVIEETPPAIEENPPVIEQAPVLEEPVPPPPPPEPEPESEPEPNI